MAAPGLKRAKPGRPASPSLASSEPLDVFHRSDADEIYELLVLAAVGDKRLGAALLKFRALSRRFKQEVDGSIRTWCAAFERLASAQSRVGSDADDSERLLYKMQGRIVSAFGQGHLHSVRQMALVSKLDERVYLSMLTGTCRLCHKKLLSNGPETACWRLADVLLPFNYTYAHYECQKKHCVRVFSPYGSNPGGIRAGCQPQSLHQEAADVLAGCRAVGRPKDVSREVVMKKLSGRYLQFIPSNGKSSPQTPLMVWLRPHAAVRRDETLYGMLQLDDAAVQEALSAAAEQKATEQRRQRQELRENLDAESTARAAHVASQLRALSDACTASNDTVRDRLTALTQLVVELDAEFLQSFSEVSFRNVVLALAVVGLEVLVELRETLLLRQRIVYILAAGKTHALCVTSLMLILLA